MASSQQGPSERVSALVEQITATRENSSFEEKELREILNTYFDLSAISRFTLGRYLRGSTEKHRKEFAKTLESYLVFMFITRIGNVSDRQVKILGEQVLDGGVYTVHAIAHSSKGAPVTMEWRLHRPEEALLILDVVFEGVSLAVNVRSQVSGLFSREGGLEPGLVALRERVARLRVEAGYADGEEDNEAAREEERPG